MAHIWMMATYDAGQRTHFQRYVRQGEASLSVVVLWAKLDRESHHLSMDSLGEEIAKEQATTSSKLPRKMWTATSTNKMEYMLCCGTRQDLGSARMKRKPRR